MAGVATFHDLVLSSMKDIGCLISGLTTAISSQTTEANDTLTIASLRDRSYDDDRFRFWYAALDSDLTTFRLVKSTTATTTGAIVVQRGYSAQVASGALIDLFLVLAPDEAKLAVNNGLVDKFIYQRVVVPVVQDQREYDLTAAVPWLHTSTQIVSVRVREEALGLGSPTEYDQPVMDAIDDAARVKIIVPPITDTGTRTLIVNARHYYDPLVNDGDTITIVSEKLIRAACKVKVLELIFNKLGPAAKRIFGQMQVLAERELAQEEARWQAQIVKRDWLTSRDPQIGDAWSQAPQTFAW